MSDTDVAEILKLPVDERLRLVELIWDSVAANPSAVPLSNSQRAELERRLADHQSNPDDVISWDDVKASITARLKG